MTKEWLDIISTVASFAVAVGTGILAWATFNMAKYTLEVAKLTRTAVDETKEGLKQADKHHQENLRPFCVIEFDDVDNQHPFGSHFGRQMGFDYKSGPAAREIRIKGRLHNRGLGPATSVTVYLNWGSSIESKACWLTRPVVVCGVIGVDETMEQIDIEIPETAIMPVVVDGKWAPTQALEFVAHDAYEVVLLYKDVFGNKFRTVHSRGFLQNLPLELAAVGGNREKQQILATRPTKPAPVFLKGEQEWWTLADHARATSGLIGVDDADMVSLELGTD
jgi:hypothetical protein